MKLKKYMLISMVAVTLASCGDDFLEEKMVATITQDYFETETGVEQLIVSTYDALRVTKQYQQGPFAFFTGVDNMMAKSANYAIYSGSVWTSTGNEATYVDGLCGEYTSNQLLGFYPCINNYCCPVKLFQTKQIRADTSHEVSALLVIFVLRKNI